MSRTRDPPRWSCQFPDYPGTVGWMLGFHHYKTQHVAKDGTELTAAPEECGPRRNLPAYRFDPERDGLFSLVCNAHARGKSKSTDPGPAGLPRAVEHSGIAHLPGSNALVTLGLWDNEKFVGRPYIRAATTLHELGHNVDLWHGGGPPTWGRKQGNTVIPHVRPGKLRAVQRQRHERLVSGARTVQGRQRRSTLRISRADNSPASPSMRTQ